jgi:hypothetical protein
MSHLFEDRQEQILTLQDCLQLCLSLESQSRGDYRIALQRLQLRLLWLLSQYPEAQLLSEQLLGERLRLRQALNPATSPSQAEGLALSLLQNRQ